MKQLRSMKPTLMVEVFYSLNGENCVTAYKRTEALEMLIKLSAEGAVINKLVEFEV